MSKTPVKRPLSIEISNPKSIVFEVSHVKFEDIGEGEDV
jgi:hypothetical protein